MNIYWLNPPLSIKSCVADTAWMNFSATISEHEWIEPIIDWSNLASIDDVVSHVVQYKPDVLCISTYMWNEKLCLAVAKEIKKIGIIVIRGGPHQTIFENIDFNCDPLATGETYLKELLTNFKEPTVKVKQQYEFPQYSTYERNISYLTNVVGTAKQLNKLAVAHLETTRGCPYSCTYCEWGGGIGTKVSQKPLDVVLKEIDILSVLRYSSIDIIDANFGILERDLQIVNKIADNKKSFGYPEELYIYGLAKVKVEKRKKILDVVFENNLMNSYQLSVQTISKDALKITRRTDIPLEENLELAKHYSEKFNKHGKLEIILGMPGSTLKDFYDEMDLTLHTNMWDWNRWPLTVLPATELASDFYQRLYKIKTITTGITENDDTDITDVNFYSDCVLTKYKAPQEIVVETFSYTVDEWKEMFFMNRAQRILGPRLNKDQIPSIAMKEFYESIQTQEWFLKIKKEIDLMIDGRKLEVDHLFFDGKPIEDWIKEYLDGLDN